jgi:hypothetical protein
MFGNEPGIGAESDLSVGVTKVLRDHFDWLPASEDIWTETAIRLLEQPSFGGASRDCQTSMEDFEPQKQATDNLWVIESHAGCLRKEKAWLLFLRLISRRRDPPVIQSSGRQEADKVV